MLHARSDYQRIQDPATNKDLCLAYQAAANLVRRYDPTADLAGDDYHEIAGVLAQLVATLRPTLGLIVTDDGIEMPAHPIEDDEPVFVLRASDKHAPATVERWASLAYDRGKGDGDLSRSATAHAARMLTWQATHGAKAPDAPANTLDWDVTHERESMGAPSAGYPFREPATTSETDAH